MKSWTFRLPQEVLDWLREKAARETIKFNKQISMNTVAMEILIRAMNADKKML